MLMIIYFMRWVWAPNPDHQIEVLQYCPNILEKTEYHRAEFVKALTLPKQYSFHIFHIRYYDVMCWIPMFANNVA